MLPVKTFIISTSGCEKSHEYTQHAIRSCYKNNLNPTIWWGFNKNNFDHYDLENILFVPFGKDMNIGAACATAAHFSLWQFIAKEYENNNPVVILEHDAVVVNPIKLDMNVNWDCGIIALGYKTTTMPPYILPPPQGIVPIKRHSGAHAYIITPQTARRLLIELRGVGAPRAIDNFYFMRINQQGDTESEIPLFIMQPTPVVGYLRDSTIWGSPSTLNYDVHPSFMY